jgi:hypothetical protein
MYGKETDENISRDGLGEDYIRAPIKNMSHYHCVHLLSPNVESFTTQLLSEIRLNTTENRLDPK